MELNDRIRVMLGQTTARPGTEPAAVDMATTSPPAIKAIATNGSLLNQNISRLAEALDGILTELGAP